MVEDFVTFFTRVGFLSGVNFLMNRELFVFIERLPTFLTLIGLLGVCFLVHDEGRLLAEGLSAFTAVVALVLGGGFPTSVEFSFSREKVPSSLIGRSKLYWCCASLDNFDDDVTNPVRQVPRASPLRTLIYTTT